MCACVYVCVCVRERERHWSQGVCERERDTGVRVCVYVCERETLESGMCVYVCVSVCVSV